MLSVRKTTLAAFVMLLLSFTFMMGCAYLLSVIVNDNETITDARAYYFFYNELLSEDVLGFATTLTDETGKLELGIYLSVYTVFNSIIVDLQSFAFASMSLVFAFLMLFVFCAARKIGKNALQAAFFVLLSVLIYSLWYPSYASVLWVWRSHMAFTLLFLGMLSSRFIVAVFFVALSILFHYSSGILAVVVFSIFIFVDRFPRLSVPTKYAISLLVGLMGSLVVGYLKQVVVSGDGNWESETNAGLFVYAYVFLFVLALMVLSAWRKYFNLYFSGLENAMLNRMFCIALFFLGLSVTSVNSHQDLMRIMQPAFIIIPFIYLMFLNAAKGTSRALLVLLLAPGIVMGLRSAYMYWGGA